MNTIWILLKANWKKQKRSLMALCILLALSSCSMTAAVMMRINYAAAQTEGMERLRYGAVTAWITDTDVQALAQEITALHGIDRVEIQPLVYSAYSINGGHSDSEGELLAWNPKDYAYRFYNGACTDYIEISEIAEGEVYLSPAMKSLYDAKIGDTIVFELSRENEGMAFRVAGFFEDFFLGSAMIDAKSFLISQTDYENVLQTLNDTSEFNLLGSKGAMLHIFTDGSLALPAAELNRQLNEQTELGSYIQRLDSYDTTYGFMMLLPDILTGFLTAFAILLFAVLLTALANTVGNMLEASYIDIAALKTIGSRAGQIRAVVILTYAVLLFAAMIAGLFPAIAAVKLLSGLAAASVGILMPCRIPLAMIGMGLAGMAVGLSGFLFLLTTNVLHIRPVQAIRGYGAKTAYVKRTAIHAPALSLSLAIRAVLGARKRYFGVFVAAVILTIFLVVVGKLDLWVGTEGEGLMNAFSVAEHDIGIDPTVSDFDYEEAEAVICGYSPIADTYRIAMPDGFVNGVAETINVLDKPEWFHVLEGAAPADAGELLVTTYVARDLGVQIGEEITVSYQGKSALYTISGFYECANGMGANVGMSIQGLERLADIQTVSWCTHYILEDSSVRGAVLKDLLNRCRLTADIHDNSWSGLDGIVRVLHLAAGLMYALTFITIGIATALSAGRVFAAEQEDIAILQSVGLPVWKLRVSFGLRYGFTAGAGALAGLILSAVCTDSMVTAVLAQFGIGGFHAEMGNTVYLAAGAFVTVLSFAFAWHDARAVEKISVTELLKGE